MTEPFGYEDIIRREDALSPPLCLHCRHYTSDGLCSRYFGVLKYIFTPERLPGSLRPSVSPEDTCPQWTSNEE